MWKIGKRPTLDAERWDQFDLADTRVLQPLLQHLDGLSYMSLREANRRFAAQMPVLGPEKSILENPQELLCGRRIKVSREGQFPAAKVRAQILDAVTKMGHFGGWRDLWLIETSSCDANRAGIGDGFRPEMIVTTMSRAKWQLTMPMEVVEAGRRAFGVNIRLSSLSLIHDLRALGNFLASRAENVCLSFSTEPWSLYQVDLPGAGLFACKHQDLVSAYLVESSGIMSTALTPLLEAQPLAAFASGKLLPVIHGARVLGFFSPGLVDDWRMEMFRCPA